MSKRIKTRIERDSMGTMRVPASAYFGASTQRAVLNFPISDLRFPRSFIRSLALIKMCAADVNKKSGDLDAIQAAAIKKAAREVASGKFDSHFVVDVFQTGSGTSTNMNANEVIATRAREILRAGKVNRALVHPNDHVNLGQSSNDVIPTATHIAALIEIQSRLLPALRLLHDCLVRKSDQLMPVIKTGRTHLQDATPITLGQEFMGYAGQIERAISRIEHACERLSEVALGGTAVGTGINTRKDFSAQVCLKLSKLLGFKIQETNNHFQAQSAIDEIVEVSGILKTVAVSLIKIANDIRWLASGPRAGLGEIALPEVQPGSSIMPGKVNPVIAESLLQVAAQVIGNDVTITYAGQSGSFELNVMQPIAAFNLLQSLAILASACNNFREKCLEDIVATQKGPEMVSSGLALVTALVPAIGYDTAAKIALEASKTGESLLTVAVRMTSLSKAELESLLDPFKMIG
jgi:fumarate hydratase, class II